MGKSYVNRPTPTAQHTGISKGAVPESFKKQPGMHTPNTGGGAGMGGSAMHTKAKPTSPRSKAPRQAEEATSPSTDTSNGGL